MGVKKSKDPAVVVDGLCAEIRRDIARWKEIMAGGCNDPFWPDRTNLNLVRNHIIYERNMIRQLCADNGVLLPQEGTVELPPVVDKNLYRGSTDTARYKRISHDTRLVFADPIKYDPYPEGQMTIFEGCA